jgi:hypothetical protein
MPRGRMSHTKSEWLRMSSYEAREVSIRSPRVVVAREGWWDSLTFVLHAIQIPGTAILLKRCGETRVLDG